MTSKEFIKASNTVFGITHGGARKGEIIMTVAKNRSGRTTYSGNVFKSRNPNLISYYLPMKEAAK